MQILRRPGDVGNALKRVKNFIYNVAPEVDLLENKVIQIKQLKVK